MHLGLFIAITVFGFASYVLGIKQVLQGSYKPSVFSRVIWLGLAIISFASTVASGGTKASVLLAGILLAGNTLMCLVSLLKGTRTIGRLEYICTAILVLSIVVWVLFDAPLLTLTISLLAHFIGALPTLKRGWLEPASESAGFWSLFFIASLLSIVASWGEPLTLIITPLYFALFDGAMTALSLRTNPSVKK